MAWLRVCFCALLLCPVSAYAQTDTAFSTWLGQLEEEAISTGIAETTVHAALDNATLDQRVLVQDQRQPETTISFATYLKNTVTDTRVREGKRLLKENKATITAMAQRFRVQPELIVALWGMESSFGKNGGSYGEVDSLVTLAYQGRRADFFRKELLATLRILDQEHMPPEKMRGSWAGAMGQCQFMPTTYLRYAADGDGDGVRDIWQNQTDVFASIANYIAAEGWRDDQTWGREVKLTKRMSPKNIGLEKKFTLAQWNKIGVRSKNKKPLPAKALKASLIQPDGPHGRSFLVYDNFRAVMRWNHSTYFATAVGLLADRIKK